MKNKVRLLRINFQKVVLKNIVKKKRVAVRTTTAAGNSVFETII